VTFSCRHYFPNEPVSDGAELRLHTLVDDLADLLRTLELTPANLVGQSSGAFVSLLLARDEPGFVRSLILAEPPALPLLGVDVPPRSLQILRLLVRDPATAIKVAKFGARGIGPATRAFARGEDERGFETFLTAALGPETLAGWLTARRQQARDNLGAFKAALRAGMPPFSDGDARRINTPTLLVTGEHSAPVLHRITDKLERLLPRVERVDLEDSSHLMFEDNPEGFNEAALAFLERVGG
jgi:pimeloyl-ACP methyl ester carboxylesterase